MGIYEQPPPELIEAMKLGPQEFTEQFSAAKDYARLLAKDTDQIIPHFLINVIKEGGEKNFVVCALDVPFNEESEKASILFNIGRRHFKERLAPIYCFLITEAWFAFGKRADGIEPRHRPDRLEVVAVFGSGIVFAKSALADAKITRGPGNKIVLDPSFRDHPGASTPILGHYLRGYLHQHLGIKSWDDPSGFTA